MLGGVVRLLVGEGVMRRIVAVFTVAVAGFVVVPQMAVGALTERVSVASNGTQGNGDSGGGTPGSGADRRFAPAISTDGRYVAFTSGASNLVPGDTNHRLDVFVRDRRSGTTKRVSVASNGTQGNGSSLTPAISADGRYVAFLSVASNLVPGDTNGAPDVFVRDRRSGTTKRVSVASNDTQRNGSSFAPAISADGRYVAFTSGASNLVPGDTNGAPDVFVRDLRSGTTQRVSVAANGAQANGDSDKSSTPAISADGRYVAFVSLASNLVPGDTNRTYDVFVRDRRSGSTERVSVATNGTQANSDGDDGFRPAISADGRYVAFESYASHLVHGDTNQTVDVFVRDRRSGTTRRVSVATNGRQGSDDSFYPAISADGRYVAFDSSSNLVPVGTNYSDDVFVRDRRSGTTRQLSRASDGTPANSDSYYPAISGDGRYVTFFSSASNLVPGDTNDNGDVFVRELNLKSPRNRLALSGQGV